MKPLPADLLVERDCVIAEIHEAFRGVTRIDGVSWSESSVLDDYGSVDEQRAARATDQEDCWEDLVDDPTWEPETDAAAFSFLDRIGTRYYLPAAMIRCVRSGRDEGIQLYLTLSTDNLRDWHLEKWSLLDIRQRQCIRRFLLFMVAASRVAIAEIEARIWQHAYDSYWSTPEPG